VSAAAACAPGGPDESDEYAQKDGAELGDDEFEYIIVGSGAGGGPLAANLARAGHKVLLLEAGSDHGDSLNYQVPALHPQSTEDATMRWDYFVKHYDDGARQATDSKNTDRGVLYPRAGTLGGCTAHNAMITVYPHESDWNLIASITGDESWNAASMRKYWQIIEDCNYGSAAKAGHGFDGWLSTELPEGTLVLQDFQLLEVVKSAAKTMAKRQGKSIFGTTSQLLNLMRRDLNAYTSTRDATEGLFTIPTATRDGHRNGPRELIIATVAEGFPLEVRTHALATRVLFSEGEGDGDGIRAIGVEYQSGERLYRADPRAVGSDEVPLRTVTATREVVVSAGTFNTPQLLKLSGIGPREELEQHGIAVRVDLPGVGTNLQDRYEVGVVSEVEDEFALVADCTLGAPGDPCLEDWQKGEGVYRTNGSAVAAILKSTQSEGDADLIVFGLPGDFRGYFPGYSEKILADKRRFTWAVLKAHTRNSAGYVRLRSSDPRDVPDIGFRYFDEGTTDGGEDGRDLQAMLEGVKFARSIGTATDKAMVFGKFDEVFPGPAVSSDDSVREFVKQEAWGHHASCTCPIGRADDKNAVLDGDFRVRGTANLRVVDASIFPKIPGFFIVSSIYMASEKATDVLLAAIGETREG